VLSCLTKRGAAVAAELDGEGDAGLLGESIGLEMGRRWVCKLECRAWEHNGRAVGAACYFAALEAVT